MMRYATALSLGTADTEPILRRFTHTNVTHPTYRAPAELGKAAAALDLLISWDTGTTASPLGRHTPDMSLAAPWRL